MVKKIRNLTILFILLMIIYSLLLIICYALPNTNIRKNIKESLTVLNTEGIHYKILFEKDFAELDNFTDSLILNTSMDGAREEGKNVVQRSMMNARYFESDDQLRNLNKFVSDNSKKVNVDYERYWMGSIVLYRPLMLIMNLQQIRYLLSTIIFILFLIAVYMVAEKIGKKTAFAYAISMFFTQIYINSISLQFFPITLLTLLSTIIICFLFDNKKYEKYISYSIFIIGSLCSFLDILTYPLLTLGIVLVLIMLLKMKQCNEEDTFRKMLILVVKYSMLWGVGYGLTFISKWLLASIILQKNVMQIAFEQFTYRASLSTDGISENISIIEVLRRNITLYFNKVLIAMLFVVFICWLFIIIKKKKQNAEIRYKKWYIWLFLIISIMPYIWMIILSNHSYIHFWMTNKMQAVTLFAILSIFVSTTSEDKVTIRKK